MLLLARRFLPVLWVSLVAGAVSAAGEPSVGTPPPIAFQSQPAVIEMSGVPTADQAAPDQAAPDQAAGMAAVPASEGAAQADAAGNAHRAAFDAVVNAQRTKILELTDRLATAVGDDAILALQLEITREKMATQRQLLELQLEIAVRETGPEGDRTRIEQLEAALAAWDAPRAVLQPVDRPAPTNPGR